MEIRSYENGNEREILSLFQNVFKSGLSKEFWQWRFQDQPLKETHIELMWHEQELAGHYGACPVEIVIDQQVHPASLSLTTMTNPNYGGQGIFPKLAGSLYEKLKSNNHSLIYGFPNANSHYGFIKKLAWKNIALIPNLVLIQAKFKGTSAPENISTKGVELSFNESHYQAFLETTNSYQVKINRSVDYLNWRYSGNPSNTYDLFEYQANDTTYYAITKRYQVSDTEAQIDLVELIFPNNMALLTSLYTAIFEYYKQYSVKQINTWLPLNDEKYTTMEKIGFENSMPITYLGYRPFNESAISIDEKKWYFSMGDSDVY